MLIKISIILACTTLTLSKNIDGRVKRDLFELPSLTELGGNAMYNLASGVTNGLVSGITGAIRKGIDDAILKVNSAVDSVFATVVNAGTDIASIAAEVVEKVGSRVQGALNSTYQDEASSIKDSVESVKNIIHQGIDTASNLTKTAINLPLLGPKLGKNLILG